jgi:hypothetical protein
MLAAPMVNIWEPNAYPTLTNVRVLSGSGSGGNLQTICAFGNVSGTTSTLLSVWGIIFALPGAPSPPPGSTPLPGSTPGVVTAMRWCFLGPAHEIPGAPCDPAPAANNGKLIVWCQLDDPDFPWVNSPMQFAGVCATTTNCYGMGTGCPEERPLARPAQAARVVHTAPRQWQVDATGFARGGGPFHNRWLLALRPGCCTALVWDNGGDAAAVPLVELRCRGVIASEWRLTFRHGDALVEFTLPADEWNDLGANVFATVAACRGDGDGVPASVPVTPV